PAMPFHRYIALGCAVFFLPATPTRGAEPWADPRLTVSDGLELWLAAGHVNEAQKALKQPALKSETPLDIWRDASGKGRHVKQPNKTAQPRLVQVGADWLVR